MNIIVCIKQVPDPEAPITQFSVGTGGYQVVPAPSVTPVVSLFDENAIEAALQLKEAHGGKMTLLTLGPDSSLEALKRGLRMGADDAVMIKGEDFTDPNPQGIAYLFGQSHPEGWRV